MNWDVIFGFVAFAIPACLICLLLDRVKKRKRQRLMVQILADVKTGKLPANCLEDPKNGTIEISSNGFRVLVQKGRKKYDNSIRWDEISEIKVFKRDLFATDLICWWFFTDTEG